MPTCKKCGTKIDELEAQANNGLCDFCATEEEFEEDMRARQVNARRVSYGQERGSLRERSLLFEKKAVAQK